MSGAAAPATLEPRSLPRIFDAVIGIERRHAWDLFVLGMLFHLPVHLFRLAGRFAGTGSALYRANPEFHIGVVWWECWNSLAVTAGAVAAVQMIETGSTSIQRVLGGMRAGGWRLLGAVAAYDVLAAGFTSSFFASADSPALFPTLYLLSVAFVAWAAPTIPAAIVERVPPWTAVARAFSLVRSNFWRVAVTVWILWSVTNVADSAGVNLAFELTGNANVGGVFDLAVDGFLYPLRGIALAVLYFDCRVRREAYDLESMLESAAP